MYYLSLSGTPPPIYMASDFSLDTVDFAKKAQACKDMKQPKREKGDPASSPDPALKNLWKKDAFEGTACKRTAK